jgi:hypothetical protein
MHREAKTMPIVVNKSARLIVVGSYFLTPTMPMEVSEETIPSIQSFIDAGELEITTVPKPVVEEAKPQTVTEETKPHKPTAAEILAAARSKE